VFLYPNGKQYIIDTLNALYKVSLTPEEFTFLGPRVLDDTELAAFPGKDTSVQLRAGNDAKVYGFVDLYYNRYDISKIVGVNSDNDFELPLSPITVDNNYDCLGALKQFTGIELTKDEVKFAPVDKVNNLVTFEMLDSSLLWTGTLTMRTRDGDAILSDVIEPQSTASLFDYPYFNTNNGQAPIYAYRTDFTEAMRPYASRGKNITTAELMNILSVTGDKWTIFRSPANWNLFESTVVYHGPNTSDLPTDPYFDTVCVVELALYCTNLAGRIYIQYNSPLNI